MALPISPLRSPTALSILIRILVPLTFYTVIVSAQAPVNDIVSWPSGLLLLATILYAALGTSPDDLWNVEPTTGLFLGRGLPLLSIPIMQKVFWASPVCHFISGIRTAAGTSNFWVRADEIGPETRKECLIRALEDVPCINYGDPVFEIDHSLWDINMWGFLKPSSRLSKIPSTSVSPPQPSSKQELCPIPSAHDFLLFAAIDYHVDREWDVEVVHRLVRVFSTKGSEASCVFDVNSVEEAIPIVAANIVRRPNSQSLLRRFAVFLDGHYPTDQFPYCTFNIDRFVNSKEAVCCIDIHSYAPRGRAIMASLSELAGAYYRVVNYLKTLPSQRLPGQVAHISVGQSLWVAILGGGLLDNGRVTFQNLPDKQWLFDRTVDEAYRERVFAVLRELKTHNVVQSGTFDNIIAYSGGISRGPAIPFLITGLTGQILVCYFLAVGTSAGVWTSVALANIVFAGRLTDLHSLYFGRSQGGTEPGFKLRLPNDHSRNMVVATLDKTCPNEGKLRPGLLLNMFGFIGAVLGSGFQNRTRNALGFSPFEPCRPWVVYTATGLALFTASLILFVVVSQQIRERIWLNKSQFPYRVAISSTLVTSLLIAILTIVFRMERRMHLWPILDALTWLSGLPLGILENGRMISIDHNVLHLVLILRWLMGAMASAVGSSR